MENSRRGRIIDLLTYSKTKEEILDILDKEFPAGVFLTSNKQALAGTKWSLGLTHNKDNNKILKNRKSATTT